MKGWLLGFGASLCLTAAPACLTPPPVQPVSQAVSSSPAAAAPAAAPPPALPYDDPKTCIGPSTTTGPRNDGTPAANAAAAAEAEAVATEVQRRIVELSTEISACQPAPQGVEEVDVALEVASDGATRAKVFGTSLAECSVINCVRGKITGLQITPPKAGQDLRFRWQLAIDPQAPVRFDAPGGADKWATKTPASSTTCLDASSATTVSGRLPPDVIRDRVRAHYGPFRGCYEAGLGRHADLQGRVTVRFVINRDGKVSDVSIAPDTDLRDCSVINCVREAFKHIKFPAPEGGIVTVQYPIMLVPG